MQTKSRITRRRLLGGTLAGLAGLMGFYVFEHRFQDLIVSILEDNLSYLDLGDIDLYAFADEYIADEGSFGMKGTLYALGYPVIKRAEFLNLEREETTMFNQRMLERFLLSTDFFWNDADETRKIQYLAYNNPIHSPCANPFAQFD
jgi:hypothetical protein